MDTNIVDVEKSLKIIKEFHENNFLTYVKIIKYFIIGVK